MQTNTVQKSRLSTITLALIPLAIVLNIVVGQITDSLTLPVFLNSIGTMLIAILAGPWVAALTGLLTDLIWGLITGPTAAAFAPVMIVIGLVTGILAKAGWFKKWWQVIISGALIGIAALDHRSADPGVPLWRCYWQRGGFYHCLFVGHRARSVWFRHHHCFSLQHTR